MRTKSGLPKRKALRRMPVYDYGFRSNPQLTKTLNPQIATGRASADSISVVSMFSGCGGLDLGFLGGFTFHGQYYRPHPFNILAAYDNDRLATESYDLNIGSHIHLEDLSEISPTKIPKADVLLGGFPCQDFSSCGHKRGFEGSRGQLYKIMVEYMRVHKPKIVVGENVPLLKGMKGGALLDTIVKELQEVGYKIKCWFLNCPDFGLPASRKRIFIICVRNDLPGFPVAPSPTHVFKHVSIDEALDDLVPITDESVPNQSQYFVATRATAGAGQGDHTSLRGKVGYAVRANSKARVHFHYELDRRLTVRECARLQSFPDQFVFPFATQNNILVIGNAVPPIVGHHVAGSIDDYIQSLQDMNFLRSA